MVAIDARPSVAPSSEQTNPESSNSSPQPISEGFPFTSLGGIAAGLVTSTAAFFSSADQASATATQAPNSIVEPAARPSTNFANTNQLWFHAAHLDSLTTPANIATANTRQGLGTSTDSGINSSGFGEAGIGVYSETGLGREASGLPRAAVNNFANVRQSTEYSPGTDAASAAEVVHILNARRLVSMAMQNKISGVLDAAIANPEQLSRENSTSLQEQLKTMTSGISGILRADSMHQGSINPGRAQLAAAYMSLKELTQLLEDGASFTKPLGTGIETKSDEHYQLLVSADSHLEILQDILPGDFARMAIAGQTPRAFVAPRGSSGGR